MDKYRQSCQKWVAHTFSPFGIISFTLSCKLAWDQMNIARSFNTTQIWILNIGTLKPLEMPTEWFLGLAWDFDRWERNSWKRWLREWAAREFGEEWKEEVGDIMGKYSVSFGAVLP